MSELEYRLGNFYVGLEAHSITSSGLEAITWKLCYERFIHSEFMTHRWSRNASSSRAIPLSRMIEWIKKDPAMPLHIGENRPGMVCGERSPYAVAVEALLRDELLSTSCELITDIAKTWNIHKEVLNRYLEPWSWINVVATMGCAQLMNFFSLRCAPEAHPNIQRLAVTMARLYRQSVPTLLQPGQWHLPFTRDLELGLSVEEKQVWSVARCAWVSYETVEGKKATWGRAKKRYDDCIALSHMTPCEHQLQARSDGGQMGCVPGYNSLRMLTPGESASEFDFSILDTVYKDRDYVIPV